MTTSRRIGPFMLADILGRGRGTILYRAVRPESTRPPRQVAMRVALDPMDTEVIEGIAFEYDVLRTMDNPRLPKAYGHYPHEGAVAMSYYEGAALADALQARDDGLVNLAVSTGLDIIIEIAHALRHAHSIVRKEGDRIVHGHLGPQRVRLTPTGDIVVVGFGAHPKGRHPAYTSPEVASGGLPSPLSDQWSLGAMLVELILGERLYSGLHDPDEAAKRGEVGPWLDRVIGQYDKLEPVLRTLLATDPEQRFRHEPEMLKSLLSASRRLGGTVNRTHLIAQVMAHADKLTSVRPPHEYLEPPASQPPPGRIPSPARPAPTPPLTEEPPVNEPTPTTTPVPEPPSEPSLGTNPGFAATASADRVDPIIGSEVDPHVESTTQEIEEFLYETETTAPAAIPVDPLAPPAPEPTPAFLPSEIAGFVTGGLLIVVGICYCIWML